MGILGSWSKIWKQTKRMKKERAKTSGYRRSIHERKHPSVKRGYMPF